MGRKRDVERLTRELTFRVIYAVLYLSVVLVKVYYGQRAQTRALMVSFLACERNRWKSLKEAAEREGKLSLTLWLALFSFWISFTFLYVIYPESVSLFVIPLPIWVRWIGVGLGIINTPSFFWIHRTLGKFWRTTLELREQHRLVTGGPYRWVRHPMYTASITFVLSLSLVSANFLMMLSSVVNIILISDRISKEERLMIERFGEEYLDYMKRTGRLLPRMG